MHKASTVISYYDLFPAGLGLDLAGAVLLAQGLFNRPREVARRIKAGRNTFARFNVRSAEDLADVIGVAVLFFGFVAQGLGYVLYIAGNQSHTRGGSAALVAIGFLTFGFMFGYGLGRATRHRILRGYLVELARYDEQQNHHEHPLAEELQMYADLLGKNPEATEYVPPELTGAALRYWKVKRVRLHK